MNSRTVSHRPWHPQSHLEAARHYLALGRTVAARQEYMRAEALGAKGNEVRVGVGASLLIEGHPKEAVAVLRPACSAGEHGAIICLAAALARGGDLAGAQAVGKTVPPMDFSEPHLCYAASVYFGCVGDLEKPIANCVRLLEAFPQFAPARLLLGRAYERAGETAQAEECFRQIYQENPRNVDAACHLVMRLYSRKEYGQAERIVRQSLQDKLNDPRLYEAAGLLMVATRRYPLAIKMLKRIVNEPVHHAVAVQNMAWCYYQMWHYEDLLNYIGSLTATDQDLPWCVYLKGKALMGLKGGVAALPYLRRYAQLRPDDAEGRCNHVLAAMEVARQAGKDGENIPALIEAIRRDFPNTGVADMLLGQQALAGGQYARAVDYFTSAVQKTPNAPDAHYMRAEAIRLNTGGRGLREMYSEWRETIRLQPNHHAAWWWLAMTVARNGDQQRARDFVERAVLAGCNRERFKEVLDQC